MEIFVRSQLDQYLRAREASAQEKIRLEDEQHIIGADQTQLVDYFVANCRVELLVIDFDAAYSSLQETMVRAEDFPRDRGFNVREGKAYPKTVVTFHLPFSGNADLLNYRPSNFVMWTRDVNVVGNEIQFSIVLFSEHSAAEDANRESTEVITNIKRQWANVDREVRSFNEALSAKITAAIAARRETLSKRHAVANSLKVPVRRVAQGSVPAVFNVPVAKKPLITKPSAPKAGIAPEPAITDQIYEDILRLIHEFGVTMERHPSLYAGKDEESLRDHLLLLLTPHFESVTGETFNKAGKTDILIRHEKSNVFVAECKFWKGAQGLLATIDQALGYLTWRDSKAALIIFVRNKDMTAVVNQLDGIVGSHPCHVRTSGARATGWHSFAFHLPGDSSKNLALNVLCFHFPPGPEEPTTTEL